MVGALFLPTPVGGAGRPPLDFTRVSTGVDTTSTGTVYSIAGMAFGAEHASRYLIAAIGVTELYGGPCVVEAVTIGGVAASPVYTVTGAESESRVVFWGALVPTGTSGTVTVDVQPDHAGCAVVLYRAVNLESLTPYDADWIASNGNTGDFTVNLNIPAGGIALCAILDFGTSATDFIGCTADFNHNNFTGNLDMEIGIYDNIAGTADLINHVIGFDFSATSGSGVAAVALR